MAETLADVTRDTLFGGRLVLEQPARGHRAGTDAVLLASAVPPGFVGRVVDAGAGVGTVGLRVAQLSPLATVTLVENDAHSAALAEANVATNGLAGRVDVAACDLLCPEARRPLAGKADLVLTNPPFHHPDRVRLSPDAGRRAAHVLAGGSLEIWLEACLSLLAPRGTLIVIHQAAALPEILGCFAPRLGTVTLVAVHPRAGAPASRVLVRGTKGGRAPFRLATPLVLHDGNVFTPEAAALHAGMASLAW